MNRPYDRMTESSASRTPHNQTRCPSATRTQARRLWTQVRVRSEGRSTAAANRLRNALPERRGRETVRTARAGCQLADCEGVLGTYYLLSARGRINVGYIASAPFVFHTSLKKISYYSHVTNKHNSTRTAVQIYTMS